MKTAQLKKFAFILPAALTVAVGAATAGLGHSTSATGEHDASSIVGVWEVAAVAPYAPHLFTFHDDGTMASTNPTNVQESPAKPHGGTNDSLGMGVWKRVQSGKNTYIVGTFEELNALADNHQPTDKLSVSFKVQLTNHGDGFDGPASATVGSETDPSHLTGTRVDVDYNAVNQL
ncbi:MAG TPA: hypothetical protein VLF71_05025 [Candidatus Saccharimonadales bacterium]|nr:hypothetical protein [Candidatus Saccharimonadales bacterium]